MFVVAIFTAMYSISKELECKCEPSNAVVSKILDQLNLNLGETLHV